MNPFEFIIIFLAFVYSLALTHLLFAWTRMVRRRRQLVLSWPHLLWMLVGLFMLAVNWLSIWDFRTLGNLSSLAISSEFLFVVLNYFFCALVSPDFEGGETYDLRRFHECEGPDLHSRLCCDSGDRNRREFCGRYWARGHQPERGKHTGDLSTTVGVVAAVRETVVGASGRACGAPYIRDCLCGALLPQC